MTERYIDSTIKDNIPLLSSQNATMLLNSKEYTYSGIETYSGNFLKDFWFLSVEYFKDVWDALKVPVNVMAASLTIGCEGFKLVNMKFANKSNVVYAGNELPNKYYIDQIKSTLIIASSTYSLKANLEAAEENECNVNRLLEDEYSEVDVIYSCDDQIEYSAF